MPTITLSNEFFQGERDKAYTNWHEAWWRENFQNSLDANSSKITIETVEDSDGTLTVMFADNGNGMTREVIEDVYLCIGKTTKKGTDSVGGFGRARILTCFSMSEWTVCSGTVKVTGKGIDYDLYDDEEPVQGVSIIARMPEGTNKNKMLEALANVLKSCTMACEVTINGEAFAEWLQPGDFLCTLSTRNTAWGSLYEITGSEFNNYVLVRVHGLTMFQKYTQYPHGLILQLDPSMSRKIMSSNRDGFMWEYGQTVDQLLSELATEGRKALRPKLPRVVKVLEGMGMREAKAKPKAKDVTLDQLFKRGMEHRAAERAEAAERLVPGYVPVLSSGGWYANSQPKKETIEERHQIDFMEHFVFEIDTQNINVRSQAEAWNPLNWRKQGNRWPADIQKKITLLRAWQEACAYMLEVYVNTFDRASCMWTTGWTFSDEHFAECRKLERGRAFLLNPLKKDGTWAVNVNEMTERKKLLGMAAHEVCHVDTQYHDVTFAERLTQMIYAMDQQEGLRRINKVMKTL